MGAGSQGFGLSSDAFLGHKQGAGWEVGPLGYKLTPIWDSGTFKVRTLATRLLHWVYKYRTLFCLNIYMFQIGGLLQVAVSGLQFPLEGRVCGGQDWAGLDFPN